MTCPSVRPSRRPLELRGLQVLGVLCLLVLCGVPLGAQATPQWSLRLDHAIRPVEGTEGALGKVFGITVTASGGVFVAERGPARVAYYGPEGNFARVVAREGAGPGEVRNPRIAASGDTVVVFDGSLNRISRITDRGEIVKERRWTGPQVGAPRKGPRVLRDGSITMVTHYEIDSTTNTAVRMWPDGRLDTLGWYRDPGADRISSLSGEGWSVKGIIPFSPPGVDVIDQKGRVVIGGSKSSEWYVLEGKDTVERVTLTSRPRPIAGASRDSAFAAAKALLGKMPQAERAFTKDIVPTTLPPWLSLDIDDDGRWWIGRAGPRGELVAWDIVEGHSVLASIKAPQAVSEMIAFGGGFVALLHEDGDGFPWIGVYRIAL